MFKGSITIYKIYKDGRTESVIEDTNIIAAGMGNSLCDLFTTQGAYSIEDFRPHYFQVGTSSMNYDSNIAASSYFYHLSSPLSWEGYGEDTNLSIENLNRGFIASTVDGGESYTEVLFTDPPLSSTTFSGSPAYFSRTSINHITKWFFDSLESEIVLDETTANGSIISEIGLFAKNPKGLTRNHPMLLAYKHFTGIPKTSEFSIVFHWSIGFLGISPTLDSQWNGGGYADRPDMHRFYPTSFSLSP